MGECAAGAAGCTGHCACCVLCNEGRANCIRSHGHDRSPTCNGSVWLRRIVGKCLLCPTGIARITDVVARIAISAAAIDEQCALNAVGGKITLKCAHIISEVIALNTRVIEHDQGVGWRCLVLKVGKNGVRGSVLKLLLPSVHFFKNRSLRTLPTIRFGRSEKKTVTGETSCNVRTPSL